MFWFSGAADLRRTRLLLCELLKWRLPVEPVEPGCARDGSLICYVTSLLLLEHIQAPRAPRAASILTARTAAASSSSDPCREKDWQQGIGRPVMYHAVVVIFLELLRLGVFSPRPCSPRSFIVTDSALPVQGHAVVMSAPLIGCAVGRVGPTHLPALWSPSSHVRPDPLMSSAPGGTSTMISMSGASLSPPVIFAYVADADDSEERGAPPTVWGPTESSVESEREQENI
ncbi:unnamed protein product [Pleuronectes platessa]|uniref:Uncharacterized protein n=1 Tax=Pleuronectes platessa TaxID=8262 RepID=A0A9N7TSA3_PLEPL|nr:unnamed protein product [Pleuronectes platessa]